jgi:hypothetical protein
MLLNAPPARDGLLLKSRAMPFDYANLRSRERNLSLCSNLRLVELLGLFAIDGVEIELGSARLTPFRFAIPCLVMHLLSAPADDPDLSQRGRLVAHPLVPNASIRTLETGPNCVERMIK